MFQSGPSLTGEVLANHALSFPQVNLIRLISKSTMHNTAPMWREQQTINMFVTALTFFSAFLVSLLPKILPEVKELGAGGYTIDHVKI